jgi:ubiquitin-like-conjugating enzyme ATG3
MVSNLKNKIYGAVTGVVGSVMPVLSETQFLEKGQLMPSEFIQAGDNLTHKCSTWK